MLLTSGVPPQFFAPLTCQLHLMESLTSFSLKHFLHPSCTPPPSSESPPSLTAPSRLPGLSVQPSSLLPVLTFLPSDLVQSRASIFSICWWLKHFAQAELSPSQLQTRGFLCLLRGSPFLESTSSLASPSLQSPAPPGYLQAAFSLFHELHGHLP